MIRQFVTILVTLDLIYALEYQIIDGVIGRHKITMAANVKATITMGDKSITFEGPSDFVDQQVEKYTMARQASQGNSAQSPNNRGADSQASFGRGLPPRTGNADVPERGLIETKKPRNHPETVAVLAFVLAESGIDEFTDQDIHRAYLRGGVRPPKVIAQAIRDAKNNHDFIEIGSRRGHYRLSAHGDRTVRFDLPRSN